MSREAPSGMDSAARRISTPIGLTLVRSSEIYGAEPYFHELTAGLDRIVRPYGHSVLLRVLPSRQAELQCYREWWAAKAVAAVVLVDLTEEDARVALVNELGIPAISVSSPDLSSGLSAVWTNDDEAMETAVEGLTRLGHERLAHVSGPRGLAHSVARRDTFLTICKERDIEAWTAAGDYSLESGERALRVLMDADKANGPTAIIFDNDLMALGGLAEAERSGHQVPRDLSLIAWDDSAQCQLSEPPLSALSHDVQRIGEMVGETVLAVLEGQSPPTLEAPPIIFVPRGTTGVARS